MHTASVSDFSSYAGQALQPLAASGRWLGIAGTVHHTAGLKPGLDLIWLWQALVHRGFILWLLQSFEAVILLVWPALGALTDRRHTPK